MKYDLSRRFENASLINHAMMIRSDVRVDANHTAADEVLLLLIINRLNGLTDEEIIPNLCADYEKMRPDLGGGKFVIAVLKKYTVDGNV